MSEIGREVLKNLDKLPRMINDKAEEVYTARLNYDEFKYSLCTIENNTLQSVTNELNEEGKAIYTNATKRQSETSARLVINEEYQQMKDDVHNMKVAYDAMTRELSFMRDRFSSAKAMSRLL